MRFLPHTDQDIARMLSIIGVSSVDDLFSMIPKELQLDRPLALGVPLSELELDRHMRALAQSCVQGRERVSFLGAGLYEHYIPHAVGMLLARSEFLTAYTPYQPEVSQGTLQAIFEYQSMMAGLLGMDVANASMYDGAHATAEGILMALRQRRKSRALLAPTLHPEYATVARTYLAHTQSLEVLGAVSQCGTIDLDALVSRLKGDSSIGCLVVQHPNFFGCLEPLPDIKAACEEAGIMLVVAFNEPLAFGILEPPGALGADLATGEAMTMGGAVGFGGPSLGVFATRKEFIRQIPGRLSGLTTDNQGRPGFVLTLSTREQHIRRERATSNICTNQGLCATAAAIYLSLLGKSGFEKLSRLNLSRAEYAKGILSELEGISLVYETPTFNEFTVRLPKPAVEVVEHCAKSNLLPGLPLSRFFDERPNELLVAVTEMNDKSHIDELARAIGEACKA